MVIHRTIFRKGKYEGFLETVAETCLFAYFKIKKVFVNYLCLKNRMTAKTLLSRVKHSRKNQLSLSLCPVGGAIGKFRGWEEVQGIFYFHAAVLQWLYPPLPGATNLFWGPTSRYTLTPLFFQAYKRHQLPTKSISIPCCKQQNLEKKTSQEWKNS